MDVFDVYLRPGRTGRRSKAEIERRHKLEQRPVGADRGELQGHIDGMIERLYGIAFGQQVVVMVVAALGVVTALLISVLQRRRELGLLRAIGGVAGAGAPLGAGGGVADGRDRHADRPAGRHPAGVVRFASDYPEEC